MFVLSQHSKTKFTILRQVIHHDVLNSYPYLDRREQLFRGISKRYPLCAPVQIGAIKEVWAESLSLSGCGLKFSEKKDMPPVGSTIHIDLDGISIQGVVRYHRENALGLHFLSPRRLVPEQMRHIIKKYPAKPIEKQAS